MIEFDRDDPAYFRWVKAHWKDGYVLNVRRTQVLTMSSFTVRSAAAFRVRNGRLGLTPSAPIGSIVRLIYRNCVTRRGVRAVATSRFQIVADFCKP